MIEFPPLPSGDTPLWDGKMFRVRDGAVRVAAYSENFAGWDDDLTALHEAEAGDGTHPIDRASRSCAIDALRRFGVGHGARVLEIGCSSGFLLHDLKQAFPEAALVGADIVAKPLERLGKVLVDIPLVQMDLLQCPLPAASFDAIVALNVLEHIEDDATALRQMTRLLKPDGVLVLEVPRGAHLYDYFDAYLRHFRRYEKRELCAKLAGAGLIDIDVKTLGWTLFPAFCAVKKYNRVKYGSRGERCENLESMVRKEIRVSRDHGGLFDLAMAVERASRWPATFLPGIRLTAVAKKLP